MHQLVIMNLSEWSSSRVRSQVPTSQHLHAPLAQITEYYYIAYHTNIDDTQLYMTLSHVYSPSHLLNKCIEQINAQMWQDFLMTLFGPKQEGLKVSARLESMTVKSASQATNLTVLMDLNFNSRINSPLLNSYYLSIKH